MDVTGAKWRKSTRSSNNGGSCVEVADNVPVDQCWSGTPRTATAAR